MVRTEYHRYFIANRYSAQEFGEAKKLLIAKRDSNPGPSRRQCDKVTITPQGKSQLTIKGAVYTVWIFICICMSLRVFLFAKKMKFFTNSKGGIHSLVELTEHDDSAANIIVHSTTYILVCTDNEWTPQRRNSEEIP